jgi:hypothetical protein
MSERNTQLGGRLCKNSKTLDAVEKLYHIYLQIEDPVPKLISCELQSRMKGVHFNHIAYFLHSLARG